MKKVLLITIVTALPGILQAQELRDPYTWPFAQNSIWNMPIGSGATYSKVDIPPVTDYCPHSDEDVLVLTPYETDMLVYKSSAAWSGDPRCEKTEERIMLTAPIPADFFVNPPYTPNMSAAIMGPDGNTLHQNQPFTRCPDYDYATVSVTYPSLDLYGDGIIGAHGGSGLSSIGGTIRLGELVKGGHIKHALKCSIRGQYSLYWDEETDGYRWPAWKSDGYAEGFYGSLGDPNPECRMGALLAIPPDVDISSLGFQTEPGLILARACQEYGMYIVDDCGSWDTYQLCTEWSPDGRVDDEFRSEFGYNFSLYKQPEHKWWQDIQLLFSSLYVITNNGPDSIGGGGDPLVSPAPDFLPNHSLNVSIEGAPDAEVNIRQTLSVVQGHAIPLRVTVLPEGYSFDRWEVISGDALISDPNAEESVVMLGNEDAEVKAVFIANSYVISTEVSGEGSIILDPDQATYAHGTLIKVSAEADEGWRFEAWSGDWNGKENPVNFNIGGDLDISATFVKDIFNLTTEVTGLGSIMLDPQMDEYPGGSKVTLTAIADPGWKFVNWTGNIVSSANPKTLTMNNNWHVVANFDTIPVSVYDRPGSGKEGTIEISLIQAPDEHYLKIEFSAPVKKGLLAIYSIEGKLLQKIDLTAKENLDFNTTAYSSGTYIAKILIEGQEGNSFKFVLK